MRWCGVRRSDTTQICFAFSATGMSPPAFECVKQHSRPSIPGHIPWHAFPVSASAYLGRIMFYGSILSGFFQKIYSFYILLHNCNITPNVTKFSKIRHPSRAILLSEKEVIDVQEKLSPEYILLFKAISKTIESLQERLIFRAITNNHAEDENIAYLQKLQLFLIKAQQDAEDIFLDRTE